MEALKDDILWVELGYSDSSVKVFRGTRSIEIIESIEGKGISRDSLMLDKQLIDNYIYDVKNKVFVCLDLVKSINVSRNKPEIKRGVDRFGNSFI